MKQGKKPEKKKIETSIVYADFLNVVQEALAMASDMPKKFRMTVDSTFQEFSLHAFRCLTDLKKNRDEPSKELFDNMLDCIICFQVFFETGVKFKAVAEGRFGKFIEQSEFVIKKIRLHGKAL